jgi:hypothetical protein
MRNDIKKQDINIDTIVITALNAHNAIRSYKAALDIGCKPSFSEVTKTMVLDLIIREPSMGKITVANPTIEILQYLFNDGLLLDLYDVFLEKLAKNLNEIKEFPTLDLISITNTNNILLLKMQIKQIECINAVLGTSKIKYTVDNITKEILAKLMPDNMVAALKYFYRDLAIIKAEDIGDAEDADDREEVFEDAVPKLTILDQLTHEKLIAFSKMYAMHEIIDMYKEHRRFFDSANIDAKTMQYMEEIQDIINSKDNSTNPINTARIKPVNNPLQRIEVMLAALRTLQQTIKQENRFWFSSKLVPILDQMITALILIRTGHNNCSLS